MSARQSAVRSAGFSIASLILCPCARMASLILLALALSSALTDCRAR